MKEQVIRNIWSEKMYIWENEKCTKETIRKYWNSTAVFTDFWDAVNEQELPKSELLPGEIIASVSQVGYYIVRNAMRLYNIHEPGYSPEKDTPTSVSDVELFRNDIGDSVWCEWRERLRLTHEISVRHCDDRSGKFKYICRAAEARNYSWSESLGGICTAKKYPFLPDEYMRLCLYATPVWEVPSVRKHGTSFHTTGESKHSICILTVTGSPHDLKKYPIQTAERHYEVEKSTPFHQNTMCKMSLQTWYDQNSDQSLAAV